MALGAGLGHSVQDGFSPVPGAHGSPVLERDRVFDEGNVPIGEEGVRSGWVRAAGGPGPLSTSPALVHVWPLIPMTWLYNEYPNPARVQSRPLRRLFEPRELRVQVITI
jgi:hypothetical protein